MQANVAVPSIHVESQGTGPPLVLLHGFAMHSGLFAPIMPALSRDHRVHAVDLPGHGGSTPIDDGGLPSIVDAIDGSIDEGQLDVLGWSLGGEIALAWSLARPSRIRRLVLVATTPSFVVREGWPHAITAETLLRFGDELRVSYRLTLTRFLALQVHGSEAGRATLAALHELLYERGEPSKEALDAAIEMLRIVDLRPNLSRIRTPALVVAGDRDTLVPIAATRALAAALPHATHLAIEGAAHAPFLSHRDAFERAVRSFLDA